ncbi:MAG TPA: condensation domain-containing protein, partial [Candidatus Angelobacter sp.]|nr:condensation domain-containing protein [Candidatus Angelobacter sp.]
MSFAQQGLWFVSQLEGPNPAYNNSIIIRVSGALDVEALNRAVSHVVQRHDSLRTRFVERGGVPSQFCEDIAEVRMDVQWVTSAELDAVLLSEARRPFEMGKDRLFRVRLYKESSERFAFVVSMHHSISDAWSVGLFIREMVSLYDAYSNGSDLSLNALPVTYLDYVHWQRDWLDSGVLERQLGYWRSQLKDLSPLALIRPDLPLVRPHSTRGGAVEFAVPLQLLKHLKSLSNEHCCSLFVTLLAGLAVVLNHYSSRRDIAIGTGVSNRRSTELEGLIGYFVNTLVLRLELSPDMSFTSVLRAARDVLTQALENQDAPYHRVVQELRPQRRTVDSSLVQVMLVLQNVEYQQQFKLHSLMLEAEIPSTGATKFDLSIYIQELMEGLRGQLEYRSDIFEETTIHRLAGHYVNALHRIAEDPESKIGRYDLLSASERHQVLYEWNETRTEFASDRCVHELFEEQVGRSPEATAVVFEGAELSYGELNRRANRIAHYLRELGVRPDARVAICVERGFAMIVALLGVLKAGGAYVPLDPAYPGERLGFMLEDSAPVALLTQTHLQPLFT